MACGCDNNGWGGCGCGNTVQYAPSACNSNFPTTCTALGQGVIQRVVGEDSGSCKYTIPTFNSNSLLSYNASTGLVNWADGSASNPIFLGSGNQVSSSTVGAIQGTTPTGQLVEFNPSTSAETQFPIVSPSGTTTSWGTIENIVPNAGVVYRPGSSTGATGNVAQAYGTTGQVLTWTSANTAQFQNAVSPSAFIDAQAISLIASSTTVISTAFSGMVFNSFTSGVSPVQNSLGLTQGPFNLNIYGTAGVGALDTGTPAANTYYYVYAIYNPTQATVNVVASTNYISPSPTIINIGTGTNNYSYYRLIGMFYTNSSTTAGISLKYNQQGRNVYLGQSNAVNIVTTASTGSNKYYSGPVTYASFNVVNSAILNLLQNGATAPKLNVQISDYGSSSPTAVVNNTVVPITNEVYGATYYSSIGTFISSVNFECFVPKSASYYNINLDAAYGVTTVLSIIGYKLSIF